MLTHMNESIAETHECVLSNWIPCHTQCCAFIADHRENRHVRDNDGKNVCVLFAVDRSPFSGLLEANGEGSCRGHDACQVQRPDSASAIIEHLQHSTDPSPPKEISNWKFLRQSLRADHIPHMQSVAPADCTADRLSVLASCDRQFGPMSWVEHKICNAKHCVIDRRFTFGRQVQIAIWKGTILFLFEAECVVRVPTPSHHFQELLKRNCLQHSRYRQ